jgi:hypothetical protein
MDTSPVDTLKNFVLGGRNVCPRCGAATICMSRVRPTDLLFLVFLYRPVRCQMCFHRWRRFASPFGDLFTLGKRTSGKERARARFLDS